MLSSANKDSSSVLPEVVPVENLKDNTIRHDESWYRGQSSHGQPHFYNGNNASSPYATHSAAAQSPYLQPPSLSAGGTWHQSMSSALPPRARKRSRLRFALLVAIPTFLITAAALGGGLGYELSQALHKVNPNNYTPLVSTSVTKIDISSFCDNNGKSTRSSNYLGTNGTDSFDVYYGLIYQEALPALNPASSSSSNAVLSTVRNIASIISYDFADCVYACASLNNLTLNANQKDPTCQSVTFVSEMALAVEGHGGNCFLKNSTVADIKTAGVDPGAISAESRGLRN